MACRKSGRLGLDLLNVLLIYSALAPEDTWMDAAHAWVFVVKSGGMRDIIIVSAKIYLLMPSADTLKASYVSTKTEFMW